MRRAPEAPPAAAPLLVFPPPPETARVQYLGAINSAADLPVSRGGFAEFVLGPQISHFPIAKPINAELHGSRLYICDTVFNRVLVYDLVSGATSALVGDSGSGKISQPNNLCFDAAGNLYVADKVRQAILIYGPDGQFLRAWGRPGQMAPVDVKAGAEYLYVCDIMNHAIEMWDLETGEPRRTIGGKGSADGQFSNPTNLALDDQGNLYVADSFNFRVQKFSAEGEYLASFGSHGNGWGQFALPKGLDVDGHGRIYVADARFCNVQVFDDQHRLLLFFGAPGAANGNLDLPAGLRVYPWPDAIPWFNDRVAPDFDPEYLVLVVSQKGAGFLNFYAVARTVGS